MAFSLFVSGRPSPSGSKTARARLLSLQEQLATGKSLKTWVHDACRHADNWKRKVRNEAKFRMIDLGLSAPISDGPLQASFLFVFERPKSHLRADGSTKPNSPRFPIGPPDVLKLSRAAEDALAGVVYWNDARIVHERIMKVYADSVDGPRPGLYLRVEELTSKEDPILDQFWAQIWKI